MGWPQPNMTLLLTPILTHCHVTVNAPAASALGRSRRACKEVQPFPPVLVQVAPLSVTCRPSAAWAWLNTARVRGACALLILPCPTLTHAPTMSFETARDNNPALCRPTPRQVPGLFTCSNDVVPCSMSCGIHNRARPFLASVHAPSLVPPLPSPPCPLNPGPTCTRHRSTCTYHCSRGTSRRTRCCSRRGSSSRIVCSLDRRLLLLHQNEHTHSHSHTDILVNTHK